MKKKLLFAILALVSLIMYSRDKKEPQVIFGPNYNYQVQSSGTAVAGTRTFMVWGIGKNVDKAVENAKRDAVAVCIFRGVPAEFGGQLTPALCKDSEAEQNNLIYFNHFFAKDGPYLGFVNAITQGKPTGADIRKIKNGYKVAIYVQVMYDNLKKQLIYDKIIQSLNSGF